VVSLAEGLEVPGTEAALTDTLQVGVPDWWQQRYLGQIGGDLVGDLNNDGVNNLKHYLEGSDPTLDYYQGILPVLTEVSGGGQAGMSGETLPLPWILRVTDAAGLPLIDAPVRITVDQGQLVETPSTPLSGYSSRVVYSDAEGLVRVYWKL
jgi:hypothetical protein